ncbi:MAG TPA: 1,4-alpha-glucan branching enzyme, partial [Nevskiaceae bacterium]|nr:1,4-alpha-glucan branching enzyme [Nevskiaceae bacterium]
MDDAKPDDLGHAQALAQGTHGDPFAFLGPHRQGSQLSVRAFVPGAVAVRALDAQTQQPLADLSAGHIGGIYTGHLPADARYLLEIDWGGVLQMTEDPYSYGTLLGDLDLYLIGEGNHRELGRVLGAQVMRVGEVHGVRFAVWAPNARRVSVVGDFNAWDGRRHPMRNRGGVWEIFIPRLA